MSIELAAMAVGFLAPYLTEAGKEAAKTVGKEGAEGGLKLLGWMREKLTGRAKAALADLENNPDGPDNQADLRKQLGRLLGEQPELVPQLQALLSEAQTLKPSMRLNIGAGGQGIQIAGNENTASIATPKS
jgi:hypothetical protein